MTRLIDADEFKSVFIEKSTEAVCGVELCKAIISRIDDAPIIDAEPVRHGKWMEIIEVNELGDAYQSGVYCSECGHTDSYEPNYCPNCGARMGENHE